MKYSIIHYFIAFVWLINGLFCKVLNFVPRHQAIVGHILGEEYALMLTKLIGLSEILMAIWILSKIKTRWNAILQIIIIAAMNFMEFFLAQDLLLWGKANAFFALCFISLIYGNEFVWNKK